MRLLSVMGFPMDLNLPERPCKYKKYELRGSLELRDLRQFHKRPYAYSTRAGAVVKDSLTTGSAGR